MDHVSFLTRSNAVEQARGWVATKIGLFDIAVVVVAQQWNLYFKASSGSGSDKD